MKYILILLPFLIFSCTSEKEYFFDRVHNDIVYYNTNKYQTLAYVDIIDDIYINDSIKKIKFINIESCVQYIKIIDEEENIIYYNKDVIKTRELKRNKYRVFIFCNDKVYQKNIIKNDCR